MNSLPFSVSMCVYGRDNPQWFHAAVESVLHQTLPPDEIVLVVDGAVPPGLASEIQKCECNPVFRVIRLKTNMGHGYARRIGLQNCTHELVALMDADDLCVPNRFELQIAELRRRPNISVTGGNITEFQNTPENPVGRRVVSAGNDAIREDMKKRCPMNQVTVLFRKSAVEAAGGYLDWDRNEDYYLWLRMALNGAEFSNIDQTLVYVRIGGEMYRRRGGLRYFRSEAGLQKFMLKKQMISFPRYCLNVAKRCIVQVLLPNRLRGWVFQHFAREKL